jgi:hypothetical protein
MDRKSFVEEFRAALRNGSDFAFSEESSLELCLTSALCKISFHFEKYDDGRVVYISEPDVRRKHMMHVLLLRYIRGARDAAGAPGSPERLAAIFDVYFGDILGGDFSVRAEYERLKTPFFALFLQAKRLPESDPIRKKLENFDISWLEDFQKRER